MVVQREDTTGMGTILLEEVYQDKLWLIESPEGGVWLMLKDERKQNKQSGTLWVVKYGDTQGCIEK
jgi:hypothetical protein